MKFPNLTNAKALAIDIESKDPYLIEKGPQFHSGLAHMVGCAIGTPDNHQWYFPIRHEEGHNLPVKQVVSFLKDLLKLPMPKVGTNLIYDLQGLRSDGIEVSGPFHDVQLIEPLIDENKIGGYNLNSLAKHYLGKGKDEEKLYQWCANRFGGKPIRKQQAGRIHLAPPEIVEPYTKSDVSLPFEILKKQWPIIKREGLTGVNDIEHRLLPLLLEMRWQGVQIDMEKALMLKQRYDKNIIALTSKIERSTKIQIDSVWKAVTLKKIFDKLRLKHPLTPKTKKPSFTKDFIENHPNKIVNNINKLRQLTKFRDTFLVNYILEGSHNGKIHCQFNQLVGENELGARSGRFSSSKPNLQNIPIRTEEGKELRKCFIPLQGMDWWKHDYSQIEYRDLVHYANGREARIVKEAYRDNPYLDYHDKVTDTLVKAGIKFKGEPRRTAKDCNFGIVYGLGKDAMAKRLGLSLSAAKKLREEIQAISPYAQNLFYKAMNKATMRGYIVTILGRRARFPFYEPVDYALSKHPEFTPSKNKKKVEAFIEIRRKEVDSSIRQGVKRAYAYTALSRLLSGSAADTLKVAMVNLYESGIYKDIPYPHLTVHDELDHSLPKGKTGIDAAKKIKQIMEQAIPLSIPTIADTEKGVSWGEVKEAKL